MIVAVCICEEVARQRGQTVTMPLRVSFDCHEVIIQGTELHLPPKNENASQHFSEGNAIFYEKYYGDKPKL